MAGVDDTISNLTDNQSFINWLRGGGASGGRGVPTYTDLPNTGRYGGYQGWEPGMPRAPGNSPSPGGKLGGTYTPSGAMPSSSAGATPSAGIGGTPANPSWGAITRSFRGSPFLTAGPPPVTGTVSPDKYAAMVDWLKKRQSQSVAPPSATAIHPVQYGGAIAPPAVAMGGALPPAAPNPQASVTSGAPAQHVPVAHPMAPQPTQPWPSQLQAQGAVPVPRPRPQPTIPVPPPRPQMAQRVSVPAPRPAPAVQGANLDQILKGLFNKPVSYNQQAVNTSNL